MSTEIKVLTGEIFDFKTIFDALPDDVKIHSYHVAEYGEIIYKKIFEKRYFIDETRDEEKKFIYNAFKYHDIGKILVPKKILSIKTILKTEDFEILKEHAANVNILYDNAMKKINTEFIDPILLGMVYDIGLNHHERWDGGGYPCGWQKDNTPLIARVCAIVDAYDAITSYRAYKLANNHDYAIGEIVRNSGTQFDPNLVNIFLECTDEFEKVCNRVKKEEKYSYKKILKKYRND